MGVDVIHVGPMPTPALAFLTSDMRCDAGVLITASHKPFQDNGIKFFGRDGYKLDDAIEAKIEELIEKDELSEGGEETARQRVEVFIADQEKLLKLLRDLHKIVETDDDNRIEKLHKQVDQREESLLLRIDEFHLTRHLVEAREEGEDVKELEAELQKIRKALRELGSESSDRSTTN